MHQSENVTPLKVKNITSRLNDVIPTSKNVECVFLPNYSCLESIPKKELLYEEINNFISKSDENATIVIISSPIFANDFCSQLNKDIHLKLWIAVKLENPVKQSDYLTQEHGALLVLTRYKDSLKHTKTRIGYTYCPYCEKTTKDYGGKKHLYNQFGTMISDVWRDIKIDFNGKPTEIIERLSDLFGIPEYKNINIYDQRVYYKELNRNHLFHEFSAQENIYSEKSILLNGDCIEKLKTIPENSIDFCFADPPYNLQKKYENWDDGIDIQAYFDWCDNWLSELARV